MPSLYRELSMLDRDINSQFCYPEELALARIADPQGLGGHSRTSARFKDPVLLLKIPQSGPRDDV